MTRNESAARGQVDGRTAFETAVKIGLELRQSENEIRAVAVEILSRTMYPVKGTAQRESWSDAFVVEFVASWRRAYNELPDVAAARKLDYLRRKLERMVESGNAAMESFAESFQKDPVNAFAWSNSTMERVAERKVAADLLALLNHEEGGFVLVSQVALQETLRRARHPEHSTSTPSNLMYEFATAAYADIADYAKGLIEG